MRNLERLDCLDFVKDFIAFLLCLIYRFDMICGRSDNMMELRDLRIEYRDNPIGLDIKSQDFHGK